MATSTTFETFGPSESIIQRGASTLKTGVTGLSGTVKGAGHFRSVRLTLDSMPVVLADNAGVVAYGSQELFSLPEGVVAVIGAVANLTLGKSSAGVIATWNGDVSIGSAAANNTATLTSTEQDIVPTTSTPAAVSSATTASCCSTGGVTLDGHTAAKKVYLNLLVDDTDHDVTTTPCNLLVSGTIDLHYVYLGDF